MKDTVRRTKRCALALTALVLAAAAAAFALGGCSGADAGGTQADQPAASGGLPSTKTITDCAGRTVEVPVDVQRVAAIHPMAGQALWRIAGEDKMVAVDQVFSKLYLQDGTTPYFSDEQRAALNELPVTAPFMKGADEEQLLSLKPDVIFTLTTDKKADQLQQDLGIPVVCVYKAPTTKVPDTFKVVGEAVGNVELAQSMADWWQSVSDRVARDVASVPEDERPTVMYVGKSGDLRAVPGKDSVYGTVIDAAGGSSVSDGLPDASSHGVTFLGIDPTPIRRRGEAPSEGSEH